MAAKRILHVVSSLGTGSGVMAMLMNYHRHICRERLQFDYLSFRDTTGTYEEEIKALTAEVSRICRRDMDLPEVTHCRTVTMLTFGERPLFTATFGTAGRPAKGQNVSGDALDCFCDTSGRAQLLLCDGMGTGRAAAVDGQMAARLTGQLLRAGFAAESAARLVNVALGLKSAEQESGATLDLLTEVLLGVTYVLFLIPKKLAAPHSSMYFFSLASR